MAILGAVPSSHRTMPVIVEQRNKQGGTQAMVFGREKLSTSFSVSCC